MRGIRICLVPTARKVLTVLPCIVQGSRVGVSARETELESSCLSLLWNEDLDLDQFSWQVLGPQGFAKEKNHSWPMG